MNKTTEALKLAEEASNRVIETLEYLKTIGIHSDSLAPAIRAEKKALAAIREAKAELGKQQPVAWMCWIDSDEEMNPANAQLTSYEPKAYAKRKPLYAAPVSAEAIRAEALEEAAKVCRTAQAQGLQSIREAIEEAIRGLK